MVISCKKENNRITSPTISKIKSIKLVNHFTATDSSITQYDFHYKTNGLLDYFIANGLVIRIDSLNLVYNNNLLGKFIDIKVNGQPDYFFSDSINYTFDSNSFIQLSEGFYTESDVCFNKTTIDSFYYSSSNLIKYTNIKKNLGCTAGSYFTERNTYHFFHDMSKTNSLTNESIGMTYCGKSSTNAIDSISLESCTDEIIPDIFECNLNIDFKAINIYDAQGRIINTNIIPPLGIFMLIFKQNLPLVTFGTDLYEITYY